MSILMFEQTEENVVIFSDTLVVDVDDKPEAFAPKVWPVPELNLVIASTGIANVAISWLDEIAVSGARDIEDLNRDAPAALRRIHADLEAQTGPSGRTTVYVFGYPSGGSRLVRYIYHSTNNFEPEWFEGDQFGIKPSPPGFEWERPATLEEVMALAIRLQEVNVRMLGEGGVPSGGKLIMTRFERERLHVGEVGKFPDFERSVAAIAARAR